MPGDMTDIEIRKLELDAQERHEAREAKEKASIRRNELFKWFVAFAWPSLLNLATIFVTRQIAEEVSAKADRATSTAAVAVAEVKKLKPSVLTTAAVTTEWRAEHTGDAGDMAKAEQARANVQAAEKPAAERPAGFLKPGP